MARKRDPKRDLAFQMWKESDGKITNREIANTLDVDEKKIATWKTRDKWNCSTTKKENVVQQNKKCSTTKEKIVEKEIKEEIIETLVDSELTDKQRLFCIYYMQSFNATQSAIKAGYSKNSAFVEGHRLLRNAKVKEYLTELKEMYAQDDYLETKRILKRHKQIAFADIKDFTEFKSEPMFVADDYETEESTEDKIFKFRIKDDVEVDGTLIKKIGMGKFGPVIELEDRSKSLEFLNKFYGLDPTFKIQIEKITLEKNKIKVLEDRNRIIENANKPITGKVKDMQKDEKINLLKKLGGA
ncbi:terminase small subunit [Cetobacterium sp.]|uniref:terminase small subunit n=1 Tax=Cetobacterium sp. TaxID=2071632 RepID=UPI003F40136E